MSIKFNKLADKLANKLLKIEEMVIFAFIELIWLGPASRVLPARS